MALVLITISIEDVRMRLNQSPPKVDWSVAQRHLSRLDPVMKGIIRRVGPCTLAARRDYFVKLCQSIYNQQISTKVAAVLFRRVWGRFADPRPTPNAVAGVLASDEEGNRWGWLSRQERLLLSH